MFSIIIPLYNKAHYIENAIRSVFNQTYQHFELILVNDGSTDNGLEIIQKIHNTSTHKFTIISQCNQGVSVARNNGVNQSKYEYIAFLDADDWWSPTFLEEMRLLINEFPHAGIYNSSYFKVKNKEFIPAKIAVEPTFNKGFVNYIELYTNSLYMPIWTGAVIINKKYFIEENGFNPKLKMGEDFDLWIRLALKYPVVFLNKPLAYYNQDVELVNRAVGSRLYAKEDHYIFNLDYLSTIECTNHELKILLDKLRIIALLPYYLDNKKRLDALAELKKVNWKNQSFLIRLKYSFPISLLKVFHKMRLIGSIAKSWIKGHKSWGIKK